MRNKPPVHKTDNFVNENITKARLATRPKKNSFYFVLYILHKLYDLGLRNEIKPFFKNRIQRNNNVFCSVYVRKRIIYKKFVNFSSFSKGLRNSVTR